MELFCIQKIKKLTWRIIFILYSVRKRFALRTGFKKKVGDIHKEVGKGNKTMLDKKFCFNSNTPPINFRFNRCHKRAAIDFCFIEQQREFMIQSNEKKMRFMTQFISLWSTFNHRGLRANMRKIYWNHSL